MSETRPEPGRHTTLEPGDRVRHWNEGYLGRVSAVQPMDEPLPDYCVVELDGKGAVVTVPHNQLVRVPVPSAGEAARRIAGVHADAADDTSYTGD